MNQNSADTSIKSQESDLSKLALAQFNSGHYKESIALYKQLLSDTDSAHQHQQIALCYWLRALSFAKRDMYKEAIVLWENQSQHIQPPYNGCDHYISWLIQINDQKKIHTHLRQLSSEQLDKDFPQLSSFLGSLIITSHPQLQQLLPQDSNLIVHLQIVQSALESFHNRNFEATNSVLKKIPFRSAFRDFRTLLKAAISMSTSPTEASSLLSKIPTSSPYAKAAAMLLAYHYNGSSLIQELFPFNHKQTKTICDIKGLSKKQFKFVDALTRHNPPLPDKIKFNLVIQHQSLYGTSIAQDYCQALLATYPAGKRDYKKSFSSPDNFEENRIKALIYEEKNDIYEAETHWRKCISLLSNEEKEANNIKIALIFRHIAEFLADYEETECLIESLDYDTDDHSCYLKILQFYSQEDDEENFKYWLGQAIERFPQDTEVLNLAIQTAMANKTYKKANQYASKLLKIDPVNTFAKQILATSHLEHARHLIKNKKFHLVDKEIQQVEKFKLGKSVTDQAKLIRGLLCFANQDKKQGLQEITQSLNTLNSNPVNSHFQATMEALLTGLPVATLLRELPPIKDYLLSDQEFSLFIQKLKQYEKEEADQEKLNKALEKIKASIKKSVTQQDYKEAQMLVFCETLDSINHFELLRHCSKISLSKWKKPIWAYYWVLSETNGNPANCTLSHVLRLEPFQEQARQDKAHRALHLINTYLDEYYRIYPHRNMGFLDHVLNMEQEEVAPQDPLEELFDHIPEKTMLACFKKLESLARKTSPEQLVEEVVRETGVTDSIILAMQIDPDFFTALMIVKAANHLKLDIDTDYADVFEVFNITQ